MPRRDRRDVRPVPHLSPRGDDGDAGEQLLLRPGDGPHCALGHDLGGRRERGLLQPCGGDAHGGTQVANVVTGGFRLVRGHHDRGGQGVDSRGGPAGGRDLRWRALPRHAPPRARRPAGSLPRINQAARGRRAPPDRVRGHVLHRLHLRLRDGGSSPAGAARRLLGWLHGGGTDLRGGRHKRRALQPRNHAGRARPPQARRVPLERRAAQAAPRHAARAHVHGRAVRRGALCGRRRARRDGLVVLPHRLPRAAARHHRRRRHRLSPGPRLLRRDGGHVRARLRGAALDHLREDHGQRLLRALHRARGVRPHWRAAAHHGRRAQPRARPARPVRRGAQRGLLGAAQHLDLLDRTPRGRHRCRRALPHHLLRRGRPAPPHHDQEHRPRHPRP
mmetsp:Transcript_27269/g.64978  ORF Transcript_27269/g.64978 Transcript_27269/m.64978 type:complete len:390 (+) Transcript_27269:135-1304(+)